MAVAITELKPGDVLLFKPKGWGILNPVVSWLVTFGHIALYFSETKRGLPLIIESIGRGVLIRTLYSYAGEKVKVMRLTIDDEAGKKVAKQAELLADNPQSFYGYWDIPRYVLPKLILAKIGKWLPTSWKLAITLLAFSYRRNHFFICSELVATAYRNAGYPLISETTIPLPDDIAKSDKLENLGDITVPKEEK